MKSELKNTIVVLGMLTMLAACGGGSGDGGSTGNSGGAPGSSYLFYSGLWLGGTSNPDPGFLYAVDPAKPGAPIPVEAGEDAIMGSIATFRVGTYDAATKTISNVHPHAVIYGKTDGRIYRIDASKNGSLAPVQVSNESAAHQMCALHPDRSILLSKGTVVVDSSNPDNSQYVYLLKGADGVCNKWKMVRLGMSANDAPVTAKQPVRVVHDTNTGAISGWLVNDSGRLRQCDLNFVNCSGLIRTITSKVDFLLALDMDRILLQINNQLFVYDMSTITLSAPLFTMSPGTFLSAPVSSDGSSIFVSYANSIYRFPADGSAKPTVLAAESATISPIRFTTNKVIYEVDNVIKSIDKTGGSARSLVSAASGDETFFFVSGDYIYYGISQIGSVPPFSVKLIKAGIMDENGGSQSTFLNATWAGLTIDPSSIDLTRPEGSVFDSATFILAETANGNGYSGATLKAFDGATAVQGPVLGTLPDSEDISLFSCRGFEDNTLCTASISVPASSVLPFQTDMFFVNTGLANSLSRVTRTGDRSEGEIFF